MLNVEFEYKKALKFAKDVPARRIPNLCAMALNRAARSVKTVSTRETAKEMGIKRGSIAKQFGITTAHPKRTAMEATVWVSKKKPLFLIGFLSVRQVRAGVKVKAYGKDKLYKRAFIATMKSGHRGVFARRKINGRRVPRLPIHELFGPPVRFGFLNSRVQKSLQTTGRLVFVREFSRLLKIPAGSFGNTP